LVHAAQELNKQVFMGLRPIINWQTGLNIIFAGKLFFFDYVKIPPVKDM
jgi:hypothetical protein